jgi:cellulase (glycosyl hydrolase family 5)
MDMRPFENRTDIAARPAGPSRSGPAAPRRRSPIKLLALGVIAAVSLLPSGLAGVGAGAGATAAPLHSRLSATCSRPIATGQVTAHNGRFYVGPTPITFHGRKHDTGDRIADPVSQLDTDATWCLNFIRLHIHWTDLEPTAPVKNGTLWTHTYRTSYMATIKQAILDAQARGLAVLVENAGNNQIGIDPYATVYAYPSWLYQAQYNSHGITYGTDEASIEQSQADFYTDTLRKQFFNDYWAYVASQLKTVPNIVGYEIMNEPQVGTLPAGLTTTQLVVDWQLTVAKVLRALDPNRVLVFTTWAGFGPGLPHVDLSHWVNKPPGDPNGLAQPLGYPDLAFMAHDYFGARWGSGLNRNPSSPTYLEFYESYYANVLNGDVGTAPPFIGSTLFHARWIQDKQATLNPLGIPLIVGEFGVPSSDSGAARFFGSVSAALVSTGVTWSMSGGSLDIENPDGSLLPYAQFVLNAAATYP